MTSVEPKVRARRSRLKPEDRREQIIDVATRLVIENGHDSVTLAEIADEVGVQKSSVLHHFPSMPHIMCAVLERRDLNQPFLAEESFVENTFLGTGPAEAREIVNEIFFRNVQQPELIRLYAVLGAQAIDESHPARSYFVERGRNSRQWLAQLLSWKTDPATSALELLAFWQGLELEIVRAEALDYFAAWDSFCDRFFVPEAR